MADLIGDFVSRLRLGGIAVSPAERIDALRAASSVGLESRALFRLALRATLAKTRAVQGIFDDAFEAHFAPPRPGRRRGERRSAGEGDGDGRRGGEGRGAAGAPPIRPSRVEQERLRPRRGEAGRGTREGGALGHEGGAAGREAGARRGRRARMLLASHSRQAQAAPGTGRADTNPRKRELRGPMATREEALLASEIAGVVREIRLKTGRRYGRGRRGRLWVKKMVRESLRQGGVPFTLPMKMRRPRRPRLVVLVDVSWSVARAAGLFLLICDALVERLGRPAIHLFVDRVVDATREVGEWCGGRIRAGGPPALRRPSPGEAICPSEGAASFGDLIRSMRDLNPDAPSDYGRAFYHAESLLLPSSGRDRVLVVLGDARSNRRDPLEWAFDGLASRCRRVIWLNPEARALWNSGDSVMDAYLPSCDVACEIRDLDGLARGVRELLRSL